MNALWNQKVNRPLIVVILNIYMHVKNASNTHVVKQLRLALDINDSLEI